MHPTAEIIAQLTRLHDAAVATLRSDIAAFAAHGHLPPPERILERSWCYPEIRLHYAGKETRPDVTRAFGRLGYGGTYCTTVTRPALFTEYLTEQLDLIAADYEVRIEVGRSEQQIPFPYVLDASAGIGSVSPVELALHFPTTDLAMIGDELADGIDPGGPEDPIPLALFDGLRTDFSLARLAHYTGTVVTTDDRNWELRYTQSAKRLSLSRAVGIDMESATIAAQGFRFRVPYGTLLCVSDKPLHGEIKLPGQANRFYEDAIASHLKIGVLACELLRAEGARLHSRKLRAFNEPPFR